MVLQTAIILGLLLVSMVVGKLLSARLNERLLSKLLMYSIYLLLFLMGVKVGTNQELFRQLPVLGLDALILTLGSLVGSLVAAKVLYRFWQKNKPKNQAGPS